MTWPGGDSARPPLPPHDRDRRTDLDDTHVLPAYPGGVDDTHPLPRYQPEPPPYAGSPAYDPAPFDATVEQPRVRGAADYPGGYDETQPLPRFSDAPTAPVPVPQAPPPTPVEVPEEESETGGRSVARHGAGMAVGSVVSRLTGFVRTAAIGAAIGGLAVANDYNIANTLPGMVYELLLGGVLSSTVVPLLVRARDRDPDKGQAYAQRLLSLAVLFLAGATVVAVLCAPLFTALLSNDRQTEADKHLTTTLAYLLLPMIFLYGMAALFAAVLNTRGHFAMPTFAPILNNVIVIGVCGLFLAMPAIDKSDPTSLSGGQVLLLGLGTTFGIVVQAAGLVPALRKVGFRWQWRWDFRTLHLSDIGRVSAWMLLYVAFSQVAQFVVFKLALLAASSRPDAPGPAIYNNAFLIFMMAHGIIAVSIITVLVPRMSAAAAAGRGADIAQHLGTGTRLVSALLVLATAGYLVLGRPLAVTVFEWKNYHHPEALATGWVIAVAGLGLIPFAISQLQLSAFYAMRDTRTPAIIILPVIVLRIVVDVLLYLTLPPTQVAAGLMVGNAVSYVLAAWLGYVFMRRRLGGHGPSHVSGMLGRAVLAGFIAAVPATALVVTMTVLWGDTKLASLAQLCAGAAVLVTAYIAAANWLGIREIRELLSMVRARLGR